MGQQFIGELFAETSITDRRMPTQGLCGKKFCRWQWSRQRQRPLWRRQRRSQTSCWILLALSHSIPGAWTLPKSKRCLMPWRSRRCLKVPLELLSELLMPAALWLHLWPALKIGFRMIFPRTSWKSRKWSFAGWRKNQRMVAIWKLAWRPQRHFPFRNQVFQKNWGQGSSIDAAQRQREVVAGVVDRFSDLFVYGQNSWSLSSLSLWRSVLSSSNLIDLIVTVKLFNLGLTNPGIYNISVKSVRYFTKVRIDRLSFSFQVSSISIK